MAHGVSGMVATFLRVLLLPVVCIGIPLWPILGILCAVPVVGIFAIPLFLLLTLLLLYSVAWFSYLILAQADPPASSHQGALGPYLPFLPYSPTRCLKINWAAFLYATSTIKVVLPAVLDWSYRRVMVLGTQGGGGIVKENILYGSPYPNKRLDVYLPPSFNNRAAAAAGPGPSPPRRQRKHSTNFAEPPAGSNDVVDDDAEATPRPGNHSSERNGTSRPETPADRIRAPVVVFVPSPIPPLTWTQKRKTYLQLALRLRRMGYCVVVPDITWYPEARVNASIIDLRLVLRWTANNCQRYGGDERRIYLLGHGMSAHLAMLTLTQEAVVLSREGFLQRQSDLQAKREMLVNWDHEADDTVLPVSAASGAPLNGRNQGNTAGQATYAGVLGGGTANASMSDENGWVDESGDDDMPPGAVMSGDDTLDTITNRRNRSLSALNAVSQTGQSNSLAFPSSTGDPRRSAQAFEGVSPTTEIVNGSSSAPNSGMAISNGLRRVEIYEPEIDVPPIAGVMLLAGVFDVIKCFRNESDRGVEHLSVLRRSCGPSHTSCLLHSPAHLLYAAKNILDTSLLPPKFLLIHGGKDAVVDISQSTLLKTLLSGIGVENVKLRAYRELNHVEALASLFLGMGKASTRYSKQILTDISDFVAA